MLLPLAVGVRYSITLTTEVNVKKVANHSR
jgi:hypothetical protein